MESRNSGRPTDALCQAGHSATASPTKRTGDRFLPRRDGFLVRVEAGRASGKSKSRVRSVPLGRRGWQPSARQPRSRQAGHGPDGRRTYRAVGPRGGSGSMNRRRDRSQLPSPAAAGLHFRCAGALRYRREVLVSLIGRLGVGNLFLLNRDSRVSFNGYPHPVSRAPGVTCGAIAGLITARIMHEPVDNSSIGVKFRNELVEKATVLHFILAPRCPCDKVCKLNSARRLRINKQWHFCQIPEMTPSRTPFMSSLIHDDEAALRMVRRISVIQALEIKIKSI